MTTKKTVSFDDMDGNTYELIIDSKKLPKGLYSVLIALFRERLLGKNIKNWKKQFLV